MTTHGDRQILLVAGSLEEKLLGLLDRRQDVRLAFVVSLESQRALAFKRGGCVRT